MRLRLSLCLVIPILLPAARTFAAPAPYEVRVVVVTTFEVGNDTGDSAGELQNWVERYPLERALPFEAGGHPLYRSPLDHVLTGLSGVGKSHTAATLVALGFDPRFDYRHAYWILACIGGVDPNVASVGSAVWAAHVVDGDLAYEIDGRKIPPDWSTGIAAYDRVRPYDVPAPPAVSGNGTLAYDINAGHASWPSR